jgi:hypothetical protein
MHVTTSLVAISFVIIATICKGNPVPKHGRVVLGIAVDQAARAGVDYRELLKQAYGGNPKALATLFRITPYMDGAGATLNSGVLEDLLKQFGDNVFSSVLARQPHKLIERVINDLDFSFLNRDKPVNWSPQFPRTYRMGSHRDLKLYRRRIPESGGEN